MTIHEAKLHCLAALMEEYGDREASIITDWVLEHVTGWSRIDRVDNSRVPLSAPQQREFDRCVNELHLGKPVQYVLGECWFAGYRFLVNPSVLIPRPETDELVHRIIRDLQTNDHTATILDVGTGSGCIPIVLKKRFPAAQIYACDISVEALETAKHNAELLEAPINFIQTDFLNKKNWNLLPKCDIVVSNPPYIPESERQQLQRQVAAFEPSTALFVPDNDALIFYERLSLFGKTHLLPAGSIYAECHEEKAEQTAELFRRTGYRSVSIDNDLQGKPRMLKATID